jgi:sugar phosphate isomerase/epimerase
MKFGCYCKPEQIGAAARAGYDYVELSVSQMLALPDTEPVREALAQHNIPCLAMADYCANPPAVAGEGFDEAAAAAYAQRACAAAHGLGARCIGVGAPLARAMPLKYPYYRAAGQAEAFFKATALEASRYGINILVEALNVNSCNFINTQHQALDIARRAAMPNVLVEADFFHMLMMAEPFGRFGDICGSVGHVHISGRGADDSRRFFAPEDRAMCREAVRVMKESGYSGTVSMEVPPELFTEEAAAASLEMLREALEQ